MTSEVLALHRRLALEKLQGAARELARILTISDRRDPISPALRRRIAEGMDGSPALEALKGRYPHEPYRLLLSALRDRLATGDRVSRQDVAETLAAVRESLAAGRGLSSWTGNWRTPPCNWRCSASIPPGSTCGSTPGRMPRRWPSSSAGRTTPNSPRTRSRPSCLRRSPPARAMDPAERESLSPAARLVLDPLALAAQAAGIYGPEALGIYIISIMRGLRHPRSGAPAARDPSLAPHRPAL